MGIKLVQAAYAWWPQMPDRPFRLLVHMCIAAKDTDENPKFFGDREGMILALGLSPEAPTSDQMVSRAVRQLLDRGAILRATNARFGKRAEFWIRVGKTRPQLDSTVKQDLTQESSNSLTLESKQVDSRGKHCLTPESTQGVTKTRGNKENREEEHLLGRSQGVALAYRAAKSRNSNLGSARARLDAESGGAS